MSRPTEFDACPPLERLLKNAGSSEDTDLAVFIIPGPKRKNLKLERFQGESPETTLGSSTFDEFIHQCRSHKERKIVLKTMNMKKGGNLTGHQKRIADMDVPSTYLKTHPRFFAVNFAKFVENMFNPLEQFKMFRLFSSVVLPSHPVHLYFDMDSTDPRHISTADARNYVIEEFERYLNAFFMEEFGRGVDLSGAFYFVPMRDSTSAEKKFSMHAHITSEGFVTPPHQQAFQQRFKAFLAREKDLNWLLKEEVSSADGSKIVKSFLPIDDAVYRPHSNLRMFGNSKPFGTPLVYFRGPPSLHPFSQDELLWRTLPNYAIPESSRLIRYDDETLQRPTSSRSASQRQATTTNNSAGHSPSDFSDLYEKHALAAGRLEELKGILHSVTELGQNAAIRTAEIIRRKDKPEDYNNQFIQIVFVQGTAPCLVHSSGLPHLHKSNSVYAHMKNDRISFRCFDPDCKRIGYVKAAWWAEETWNWFLSTAEMSTSSSTVARRNASKRPLEEVEPEESVEGGLVDSVGNGSIMPLAKRHCSESSNSSDCHIQQNSNTFEFSDRFTYNTYKKEIDSFFDREKWIVMKAAQGTGKTEAFANQLERFFQKKKNARVLWISGKRAYARNVEARLNRFFNPKTMFIANRKKLDIRVGNYLCFPIDQNKELFENHQIIILSLESFARLISDGGYDVVPLLFDVVVVDEVEEIAANTQSETLKGKRKDALEILNTVLSSAGRVWAADADFSDNIGGELLVDYCSSRYTQSAEQKQFFLIHNTFKPFSNRSTFFHETEWDWCEEMRHSIKSGLKIAVATNSRKAAKFLETLIEGWTELNVSKISPTGPNALTTECERPEGCKKILVVHGQSADDEKDNVVQNLAWKHCDVFVYTPFIGQGVDFPDKYFDVCFVYGINTSTTVRQLNQQQHRFRSFSKNRTHIYLKKSTFSEEYLPTEKEQLQTITLKQLERLKQESPDHFTHELDPRQLVEGTGPVLAHLIEDKMTKLFINQQIERNRSNLNFEILLLKAMEYDGMKLFELYAGYNLKTEKEQAEMVDSMKAARELSRKKEIEAILAAGPESKPSEREIGMLEERIKRSRASKIDKHIMLKLKMCEVYGVEWNQLTDDFIKDFKSDDSMCKFRRYSSFIDLDSEGKKAELGVAVDAVEHSVKTQNEFVALTLQKFERLQDVEDLLFAFGFVKGDKKTVDVESKKLVTLDIVAMIEERNQYLQKGSDSTNETSPRSLPPLLINLQKIPKIAKLLQEPDFLGIDVSDKKSVTSFKDKLRRKINSVLGKIGMSLIICKKEEVPEGYVVPEGQKVYQLSAKTWEDVLRLVKKVVS